MNDSQSSTLFAGSIPQLYQELLVPMIFQTYAQDLCVRLASLKLNRVLEVAAGTGVLTRCMASTLPSTVDIVATDLNRPMLDLAERIGTSRPVRWQQADATSLPFDAGRFDAVVCQFGFMFVPDKAKAFSEARRVLRPGGTLLFNVWDRVEENEFAHTVHSTLGKLHPDTPPGFIARVPHGYHDRERIEMDLRSGGFESSPANQVVSRQSVAATPLLAAIAYCQGTPVRHDLEVHGTSALAQATASVESALADRFGPGPIAGKIQASVFTVER